MPAPTPATRDARVGPAGAARFADGGLADAVIGVVVTAPLLAGLARPGFPLLRDWVATPRPPLSDAALGLGESAARAVPQDVAMVWATRALDGLGLPVWPLTGLLTAVFCVWLAMAAGALTRRVVPGARARGAAGIVLRLPVVVAAVWNPFVVERLLQGHWSLLAGVAAALTMPLVLARARPRVAAASVAVVVAGLTPTGWVLAVVSGAVSLACAPGERSSQSGSRFRRGWAALTLMVVAALTALPWLLATLLAGGGGPSSGTGPGMAAGVGATGVEAFAARAETGIGTLGSVVALGGIWNSSAVPLSRETWWAAAALVLLLVVWAIAAPSMWRARRDPLVQATVPLALVTWLLVALAATGPGLAALDAIVSAVPGAGLVRDTQKFVALALPATVVAFGFATRALATWLRPAGAVLANAGAALAITAVAVASVPDAPAVLWNALRPVTYGPGWAEVNQIIAGQQGDVLVLPAGSFRSTTLWADGAPVLDPAPRLLDARVLVSGELVVGSPGATGTTGDQDRHTVSGEGDRARAATLALLRGEDPRVLADLGVRWVLDEKTSAGPRGESEKTLTTTTTRFTDPELHLYEIAATDPNSAVAPASSDARVTVLAAHAAWLLTGLVAGAVAAAGFAIRRRGQAPISR